ncbi:hypothetical protein QBC44DRAFT_371046 [Cladorrhinum sp. PSN332]|nr:hypothetical protein QBC44DRAFT_371046 [Cladorrhinum sp. PSN332]
MISQSLFLLPGTLLVLLSTPSTAQQLSAADRQPNALANRALQNPNATRSVNFRPFPSHPQLNNTEWTWRVNVSDFSVPPDTPIPLPSRDAAVQSSDPHLFRISYDFSWGPPGTPFPSSSIMEIGTPANITNLWTDNEAGSTDCTPVLGKECVEEIMRGNAIRCQASEAARSGYCPDIGRVWSNIPECASSFGFMRDGEGSNQLTGGLKGSFGIQGSALYSHKEEDEEEDNVKSGEMFTFLESRAPVGGAGIYDGANGTEVLQVGRDMLQVLLFNPPVGVGGAQLMCMRIDTRLRAVGDGRSGESSNGAGGDPGQTRGDTTRDESSAARGGGASFWRLVIWLAVTIL